MMQDAMLFLERLHINHAPLSHFYEPLWLFDGQPPPPVETARIGQDGQDALCGKPDNTLPLLLSGPGVGDNKLEKFMSRV
jgi:hypothetical protein